MSNVIFVIPRIGGGGAERVTTLLSGALREQGYKVTILTLVEGESFYKLDPDVIFMTAGIKLNRRNRWIRMVSELIKLPHAFNYVYREVTKNKYAAVISFLWEADIIVGLCKVLRKNIHHICSLRNDPARIKWQFIKMLYTKADHFVCQSQMVYDYYSDIPPARKTVIPNPVSPVPQNMPLPVRRSRRVVSVGRLTEQKNFPLLIESFATISTAFPEYNLEIYGEGPLHGELQAQIDALGMTNRVKLCGAVQDIFEKIVDAELFVMSSDYEGFPNALVEAMALGLPVISTDFSTGIARELIGPENGRVVPIGDARALAQAMEELLVDTALRERIAVNNKEKTHIYGIQAIARQWAMVIDEIE